MATVILLTFLCLLQHVLTESCVVSKFEDVEEALKCNKIVLNGLQVPAGVTLKLNLTDGAEVIFRGTTTFGFQHWDGPLVTINGTGITVKGEPGAIIDGLGQQYWDGQGGWSNSKPQFFTIQAFGDSVFKDIHVVNSPKDVVHLTNSDRVTFTNWLIDDSAGDPGVAPEGKEGHNTDGFDVWNSTNIAITHSVIYNQDDCVAVRCGGNIFVSDLYCHGSHGLSISVGFSNDTEALNTLTDVVFQNTLVEGGRNGLHIKTHVDGGFGNITGVIYRNITMRDISYNGILLHENYTNNPPNSSQPDVEPRNNIPIRELYLEDVTGSVNEGAVPVEINCADEGCFQWEFLRVNVTGGKKNSCNFEPVGFDC